MARFLGVFAIFLLSHLIAATPAIRRRLVALLGEVLFTICYSAMSLALFTWLIKSAQQAPYIELWPPQVWTYAITVALMPVAALLFGAGLLQPNPFSIAFVARPFDANKPGVVAITRHPLLWALGLWGLAHVPANGDLAAVIMFGGLGSFAMIGMWAVETRKRKMLGEAEWQRLAGPTSVLPFAALLGGRARWPTDRGTLVGSAVGLAVAVWLVFFGGHFWLVTRNPLAMF
ncbi:MAG: NnrU family protein [Gammaproteobacteria bacterium]|jgi:uncharacterized membrane protein|nr:NnrU family protein [Gammaproteobacteria bacterium]